MKGIILRLIDKFGPDGKLTDWLASVIADCPKRNSVDMSDQCAAQMPDSSKMI
jgi:hypothetical protein